MLRTPPVEEFVLHDGVNFRVEWYYTQAGEMPAKDYYLTLAPGTQDSLMHQVKFMSDRAFGSNRLPKTMYMLEDSENKIYAFKPQKQRFFNFMTEGRSIVITNAYQKHSQKMTAGDKKKLGVAAKCRLDYLKRVQEGTYYEDSN